MIRKTGNSSDDTAANVLEFSGNNSEFSKSSVSSDPYECGNIDGQLVQ